MPEIRKIQGFTQRELAIRLAIVLPAFALFGFAWWQKNQNGIGLPVLISVAGFLAWIILGTYLTIRRYHHFRCPQCSQSLPYVRPNIGECHVYDCPTCDIIWDTGMKRGGDSE